MRTIDETVKWLRDNDPETALTKTALRRLVISGELPSRRIGQKYLICLEVLEDYLRGVTPVMEPVDTGKIRRIEL